MFDIDYTSEDGKTQTNLTPELIDEQIVDVQMPLPIWKKPSQL